MQIKSPNQCRIQDFSGQACSLFCLASPWGAAMVDTEVKISKICLSSINVSFFSGVFLVYFQQVISAIFFVTKLVILMLAYIMSNTVLIFRGQKILFQSFLVELGENLLEFYLLVISLFLLDGKEKQINFWFQIFFFQIWINSFKLCINRIYISLNCHLPYQKNCPKTIYNVHKNHTKR